MIPPNLRKEKEDSDSEGESLPDDEGSAGDLEFEGKMDTQGCHTVIPEYDWCSCGRWQEYGIPCRHAMAVFMWEKRPREYCTKRTSYYHKYVSLKNLYEGNHTPVTINHLVPDGVTTPPPTTRQAGRPKKKRMRSKTEFFDNREKSGKHCSFCGKPGHNRTTCPDITPEIRMEMKLAQLMGKKWEPPVPVNNNPPANED